MSNRIAQRDKDKCQDLLSEFCHFLDKQPKPSDNEVRLKFIELQNRWRKYCAVRKLTDKATLMFNKEVAIEWWTVYAIKKDNSENVTQK
jgi:hypothetical protein